MTDQDLEEKFHGMAEKFMTERRIKEVIATIYELEKLNDIGELMSKVVFRSERQDTGL
jgi:hypothetical protein